MQGELVEALDLVLARRASGALPGERRAAGRGTGTELAQIRPYQVGDDVRRIDAAASARTGHPHVRDYIPERTLTTWLLVDVSASMAFGTADRLKSDVAEGIALVIGRLAVRRAGRVGLLTCGAPDRAPAAAAQRPRAADRAAPRARRRRRARRLRAGGRRARRGPAPDRPHRPRAGPDRRRLRLPRWGDREEPTRPGASVAARAAARPRRPEWARALQSLSLRHDVLCVEVVDRREGELPDAGHLVLVDPETGKRVEADSSSAELRRRFAAAELARRDTLKSHLRRAHARHVEIATDDDWLRALGRSLR